MNKQNSTEAGTKQNKLGQLACFEPGMILKRRYQNGDLYKGLGIIHFFAVGP